MDIPPEHEPTARFIRRSLSNMKAEEVDWTSASPRTDDYNCVGFAVDDLRCWQPRRFHGEGENTNPKDYWPDDVPDERWVSAYKAAVATRGFAIEADGPEWEEGFDKIVLIEIGGICHHVARLIAPGRWKSKLGGHSDIEHTLEGILGGRYGSRCHYLKRLSRPPSDQSE